MLYTSNAHALPSKSHFSYSVSGAISATDSGELLGVSGIPSKMAPDESLRKHKSMCYVQFRLKERRSSVPGETPDIGLTFKVALLGKVRRGYYPIGKYKIIPDRVYADPDPWGQPLSQKGSVFAAASTGRNADRDGMPDEWLSQSGWFEVTYADDSRIDAKFEVNLIEARNEFLGEVTQMPRRSVNVKGEFAHPLKTPGRLKQYYCDSDPAPLYIHYYLNAVGVSKIPETKENPSCKRARDRLWSDRLFRKGYSDPKWIELLRKENIQDSDAYHSLVYRQVCMLGNQDREKEGIAYREECGTVKDALMQRAAADSKSLMTTDSETGEIDLNNDHPLNKIKDIAWESIHAHEKHHQKQIAEHDACFKTPACIETLEKKYPQAPKIEENSEMYRKHSWFVSQHEIEGYDVGIKMLEDWIKKRCKHS